MTLKRNDRGIEVRKIQLLLNAHIVAVAALLATASQACASGTTNSLAFPTAVEWCQSAPGCGFTADDKAWPEKPQKGAEPTFPLSNLTFTVNVPVAFTGLTVAAGAQATLVAQYPAYRIAVSLEELPEPAAGTGTADLTAAKARSKRKPIDVFDILFTAKPEQPEPKNLYEAWLWRSAFAIKARFYESTTKGEIRRNGKWTAFIADVKRSPDTRATVITHKDIPSRYLRILDTGAPDNVIAALIASAELDRPPSEATKEGG